ncbi:MAG: amidohydrolase family protein [Theionarchaea archaeon]|nr:amidohydrolase family protein [Theionarchaea archaeon]
MIIDFNTEPLQLASDISFPVKTPKEVQSAKFIDKTQGLIRTMDKAGIDISVVVPVLAPSEVVSRAVSVHEDRLIGFAYGFPHEECREDLREAVKDFGLKGVKLFPVAHGLTLASPEYRPLYEEAEKLHIPVMVDATPPFVFHMKVQSMHQFSSHPDVYTQQSWEAHSLWRLLDSPLLKGLSVNVVAEHLGGGVPLYWYWGGVAERYNEKIAHIFFDTSHPGWITSQMIRTAAETVGVSKLLFASDVEMFANQKEALAILHDAGLSPEDEERILYKNAASLLFE